jgi:sortase A
MTPETEQRGFEVQSRVFLRWMRNVLFLLGALAVSYVGLVVLHAEYFQQVANSTLEQKMQVKEQRQASGPGPAAKEGDVLGRIEIPRLGTKVAILEGTTPQTLAVGVGHIAGTALPGGQGNIGIAGHRDTYFRALRNIQSGDEIRIQSMTGLAHYKVDRVQIVAPDDISVLAPAVRSAITLVTCYPFYFVGAAPKRFVVHAYQE